MAMPKAQHVIQDDISRRQFRLRESIRAAGLLEPLVVQRDETTNEFTLVGGGRTRLKLLESLFAETGDKRYQIVTCVEPPAKSISNLQLSHLVQNRFRRTGTFVHRALRLMYCVQLRNEQVGDEMTQAETVRWLNEQGYIIGKSLYSEMYFVGVVLNQGMPKALAAGLSKTLILAIRRLYRSMLKIWKEFADEEPFDDTFREVCQLCDTESKWSFEKFQKSLAKELGLSCSFTIHEARMLLNVGVKELDDAIRAIRRRDRRPTRGSSHRRTKKTQTSRSSRPQGKQVEAEYLHDDTLNVNNRRKQSIKSIALKLADESALDDCVRPSSSSTMGYSVLHEPTTTTDPHCQEIWKYLKACDALVQTQSSEFTKFVPDFCHITCGDWDKLRNLIDTLRTIRITMVDEISSLHQNKAC